MTRAPVSAAAARRARAVPPSATRSLKPLTRPPEARTATWRPSSIAWPLAAAPRKPPLLSAIPSSSLSGTCSITATPTTTWVPITSTLAPSRRSLAISSDVSKRSATTSTSTARQHEPGARFSDQRPALRHTLIEAAHAAARSKNSYLAAQFHRLAARRGTKKAAVAVGHTILVIVWHLLDHGDPYHDLGANYFDSRAEPALTRHLVRRLKALGYDVHLDRPAA